MERERLLKQHNKETVEEKDPMLYASEDGSVSVLADLIRVTEIPSKTNKDKMIPYRAQGPFIHNGQLWYFQADNVRGWWFHRPVHPDEFVPLINAASYTDNEKKRFQDSFPSVLRNGYASEPRPCLDEVVEYVSPALAKAIELLGKE
jgi:hypothetical protein